MTPMLYDSMQTDKLPIIQGIPKAIAVSDKFHTSLLAITTPIAVSPAHPTCASAA